MKRDLVAKDELLSTPVYPSPVLNVRLENLYRDIPLVSGAIPGLRSIGLAPILEMHITGIPKRVCPELTKCLAALIPLIEQHH